MSNIPKPRFSNVTAILGVDCLSTREQQLAKGLDAVRRGPENQYAYSSLAGTYRIMAIESWALGYPLESVVDLLRKHVAAELNVFRLRGTRKGTHTKYTREGVGVTSTTVDYGTGNPWKAFEAACIALSAGEGAAAKQIAEMIWDPSEAEHIHRGPESDYTPEHQKVAFAFRDLYLGKTPETLGDLPRISLLWKARRFPKHVAYNAGILRAVATSDSKAALDAFNSLIFWYAHEASKDWRTDRYRFLYLPPLGLSIFLISRGLLSVEQLPQDKVQFPLEMLRLAVAKPI